jgi:hypothetical protein
MRQHQRWAGAMLLVALVLAAGACSGGSSSSALGPPTVERFVLAKEATASLTRLVGLIQAADTTVQLYSHQRPGTAESRNLLYGARLGWNNVSMQLNAFTLAEGDEVPAVTAMVGRHKLIAVAWLNALDAQTRHPAASREALLKLLAKPQRQELKARPLLQQAGEALAKLTCSLDTAHHELATAKDAAAACGTAKQLG